MRLDTKISFLPSALTDKVKWEQCLLNNNESNFFMQAWVLDLLCEKWSAVIINDYQAILPVPHKTKLCLPYIYQVPFIQKFSLIGVQNPNITNTIAAALNRKFPLVHMDCSDSGWNEKWIRQRRKNFILSLTSTYNEIYASSFTDECRRNIDKAKNRGCNIEPTNNWSEIIFLYHSIYGHLEGNHLQSSYNKAINFLKEAERRNACSGYNILSNNNELLYSGIIIKGQNRLYYWLGAPTQKGRTNRVTYFFIDYLIKENAGKNLVFDFEGSDFPNVAKFYSQFTQQYETYVELKHSWL